MKPNDLKHSKLTRGPIGTLTIKDLSGFNHIVMLGHDYGRFPPNLVVGAVGEIGQNHDLASQYGRIRSSPL